MFKENIPPPLPTPDVGQAQDLLNNSLVRRLQAGGSNADQVAASPGMGLSQAAPRLATLTGINS